MCNSKKPQKKNVRSQRGIPETNYGEIKKIVSFSLTPTAQDLLKEISLDLEISASELLERFARIGAELKDNFGQEVILEEPTPELPGTSNKP